MAIDIERASRELLNKEARLYRKIIYDLDEPEINRKLAQVQLSKIETEIACRELRKENYLRSRGI